MGLNRRKKRDGYVELRGADPISMLDEGENLFAESVDAGHRIDPRAQKVFVLCVALVVLYVFALVVPKDMFNWALHMTSSAGYTFSWFINDLSQSVGDLAAMITGNADAASVGFDDSMVRYVVIALAGAGLALSGAIYQGAFRNALVSPSTLGVMTGGSFGTMIWVVFFGGGTAASWIKLNSQVALEDVGLTKYLASSYGAALISFAGCLIVVGLVLLTVKLSRGGTSALVMIITGQMISGVLGAVSSAIRYYYTYTDPYGTTAELLQNIQIASFWRVFSWIDILAIGIPLMITFIAVMRMRQKMMAFAFDEAEQRTLGLDSKRIERTVVVLCTLLTAIVVSFCGAVGFVGFMVPHMARRIVGPNFKYLLPASTVLGAIFVLGAYTLLLMTLGTDYSTMVGMYISMGGAVVFLITAIRGKGVRLGSFR